MKRCLFLTLLLAACAPQPPVFKPVPVDVPVATPCPMKPVTKPDFALGQVRSADDAFAKTKAALIEIDQRKAYEAELESQLTICQ